MSPEEIISIWIFTKSASEIIHDGCHHSDLYVVEELGGILPAVIGRFVSNALQPLVYCTVTQKGRGWFDLRILTKNAEKNLFLLS